MGKDRNTLKPELEGLPMDRDDYFERQQRKFAKTPCQRSRIEFGVVAVKRRGEQVPFRVIFSDQDADGLARRGDDKMIDRFHADER